jgi:hypothetical protein
VYGNQNHKTASIFEEKFCALFAMNSKVTLKSSVKTVQQPLGKGSMILAGREFQEGKVMARLIQFATF